MSRKFEYRNPRRRPAALPLTAHSMFVHTGLPCSGFDCLCHAPGFGVLCGKLGAGHPGFVTDRRFSPRGGVEPDPWSIPGTPCPKTTLPNFLPLTAMESSPTAGHPALCKPCWTRCVKRACPRWYAPATAPGTAADSFDNNRVERCLDEGIAQEDAVEEASRYVAQPGTSEHELGLAADIVSENYQLFGGRTGKYRGTAVADGTLHGIWFYPPLSGKTRLTSPA